MNNILDTLACKYGVDKKIGDGCHGYVETYYNLLRDNRDIVKKVMEIGVWKGGSLKMWQDFFPLAQIYGLDNHKELLFEADRIKCFFVEQKEEATLFKVIEDIGKDFDLIVDDGSHEIEDQLLSFKIFFPIIKKDGIYVIEDVFVENFDRIKIELKDYDYKIFPSNLPNYSLIIINK